jgi:CDP-paratose 2-epimerase
MRVLVTGGAGFIGSSMAVALAARHPEWQLVAADNLYRRGSELTLPRLKENGVEFVHADVRQPEDLNRIGEIDALVECSAEPSVLAGIDGGRDFVVKTNLVGAYHCLELAAAHGAQLVFLSTSRVYPLAAQNRLAFDELETRFELLDEQVVPGASSRGVSEEFPLEGARTLYGASKLAAELLITEYEDTHGLRTVVNRCGVIAGPWQMGKVDQGVFTHWMLAHYFRTDLAYIGYGGSGKQVRDLLHVDDLIDLVDEQLVNPECWNGGTYNVGGGRDGSLSLLEATEICRELTGHDMEVQRVDNSRPGDVRVYLSDCQALFVQTNWRPRRTPPEILADIFEWIRENEVEVRSALM